MHGHYDSWDVGVGDNATGDATMLEIARLLQENKSKLNRSVKIVWWPGHSTGRYAGSTWYADNFGIELSNNCVAQINCDSPGCRWADTFDHLSVMTEAEDYVHKIIKGVAITRVGFASASLFPVFSIGCYYAGIGDGLFSPVSLTLTTFGILFFHLFSNLYNDYFDVTHGTDEANTEYFNAGMDSTILQGAQLSGGSRAVELGLISLKGTKSLANVMFILGLATAAGILYMSFLNTGSTSNAFYSAIIALIGVFVGYFYTAKPIRLSSRYGLGELSIFLSFGPLLTCLLYTSPSPRDS